MPDNQGKQGAQLCAWPMTTQAKWVRVPRQVRAPSVHLWDQNEMARQATRDTLMSRHRPHRERKRAEHVHRGGNGEQEETLATTLRDLLSRQQEIGASCEALDIDVDSSPFTQARWAPQRRVVAFSDIHGDFQVLVQTLRDCAQVVSIDPRTGRCLWTGGDTFIVIVGDMVDRFRAGLTVLDPETRLGDGEGLHDEMCILLLLNDLSVQALKQGGRIIKCLGNHEVMNLRGQFTSVTPRLRENGRRAREWHKDDSGRLGEMRRATWDCGAYAVVQIGQWVFCHGGITSAMTNQIKRAQKQSADVERKHKSLALVDFVHQAITRKYDVRHGSDEKRSSRRMEQAPLTRHVYESGRLGPSILWNARASSEEYLDDETCDDILRDLATLGAQEIDQGGSAASLDTIILSSAGADTDAETRAGDHAGHDGSSSNSSTSEPQAAVYPQPRRDSALMAPTFLVVGHSQQRERHPAYYGWAPMAAPAADDACRAVYVFDPDAAARWTATRRAQPTRTDPIAINGVCAGDAKSNGIPRVWRVDAATSRSFSRGHKNARQEYPHAQALEILFDSKSQQYLRPRLLVSTRPRSTAFVRRHAHHRHGGRTHPR